MAEGTAEAEAEAAAEAIGMLPEAAEVEAEGILSPAMSP